MPALDLARSARRVNIPWLVLGVLVISGSALGFAVWASSVDERVPVVSLARGVSAGASVALEDLTTTLVAAPSMTHVIPGGEIDSLVGLTALADLRPGALVTHDLLAEEHPLGRGEALVGVPLGESGLAPDALRPGLPVMIVPARTASFDDSAQVDDFDVSFGHVSSIRVMSDSSGLDVSSLVLRVPLPDAPSIARAASGDGVRIVVVSSLADARALAVDPPDARGSDAPDPVDSE